MRVQQFVSEWEEINENLQLAQIKEYWEVRADEFNEKDKSNYEEIVRLLDELGIIDNSYDILDIGCGPGKLSLYISSKVNSITGIDISEKMICHARANAKKEQFDNTQFKVASWEEINLKSEGWEKKFDVVIGSSTMSFPFGKLYKVFLEGKSAIPYLDNFTGKILLS